MNGNRLFFFVIVIVFSASSLLVYQKNTMISELTSENDDLWGWISELNSEKALLETQIETLKVDLETVSQTVTSLYSSLQAINVTIHENEEIEVTSFARVVEAKKDMCYTFEANLSYSYTVEYSFPESTTTVFTVLDTDKVTVLGQSTKLLDGTGTETVKVIIPTPESSTKWIIAPSVYWVADEVPQFSEDGWFMNAIVDVNEGSEGHTQGSCSDESAICHAG